VCVLSRTGQEGRSCSNSKPTQRRHRRGRTGGAPLAGRPAESRLLGETAWLRPEAPC